MKKIIVVLIGILCLMFITSCGSVTYLTKGDMVVLDGNGNIVKEYDDATFQSETYYDSGGKESHYSIKEGGSISFVDKYGNSNFVSGGIIIIENMHYTKIDNNSIYNNDSNVSESRYNSIKYKELGKEIDKLKKEQKNYKNNSVKYNELEKKIQELSKQRMEYLGKINNIY